MQITGYQVGQYRNGIFESVLAGMGKNKGTWDSVHSKSAAYRHVRDLKREGWRARAGLSYRVLKTNI